MILFSSLTSGADRARAGAAPPGRGAAARRATGRPAGDLAQLARDVLHGIADGHDLLGIFVRDVDLELVLELHHELDGVERVGTEIVDERRLRRDLVASSS